MKPVRTYGRDAALTLVLGAIALGGALSACGRVGPLEQPPPLLGAENKRDYYAAKEQRAREEASLRGDVTNSTGNTTGDQEAGDDNAPLTTRDVLDPNQRLTTPRDSPVPGAPNPAGPTVSTTPYSH
jgi:predicted small lipoprotein YifL